MKTILFLLGFFVSIGLFSQSDSTLVSADKSEDTPLMFVSDMPYFADTVAGYYCGNLEAGSVRNICTQKAIRTFIMQNYVVPPEVLKKKIEGRVYVGFVVNKKGDVEKVKILRSNNKALEKPAIEVVKKLPKFVPGKLNGQPRSIMYQLPILIKL